MNCEAFLALVHASWGGVERTPWVVRTALLQLRAREPANEVHAEKWWYGQLGLLTPRK